MDDQLLLSLCMFGAVAALAYFALRFTLGTSNARLHARLTQDFAPVSDEQQPKQKLTPKTMLLTFCQAVAKPFMPKNRQTQSELRQRLARAGIYSPSAVRLVAGFKLVLLVSGAGIGYLIGLLTDFTVLSISLGALVGYVLPVIWLRACIKAHQQALAYGLADALDLMVVCVEAGLTIDSAIQRVGQELMLAHPRLGRELEITHMETRVGLARSEALRNLGQRTGSRPLQSLGAMLIQADRFGTSIGQALRVHADGLRATRQHAAEEMAAKASVKMSFPLVLFIFPATFIVMAGPTVIKLMAMNF